MQVIMSAGGASSWGTLQDVMSDLRVRLIRGNKMQPRNITAALGKTSIHFPNLVLCRILGMLEPNPTSQGVRKKVPICTF